MTPSISIAGRPVGLDHPPYIVAELSANHNGSLERAMQIIASAKVMGANAIKLQSFTPDSLTMDANGKEFQIEGGLWDGYSLYELYEQAQTPLEWHKALFDKGREVGITVFSTPFDERAIDLLMELGAPAFKVASFEVVDLALISRLAKTGKPLMISTGMASLDEISEAVDTARNSGCSELVLFHCISGYPTPIDEANLRTIPDLAERFETVIGLSDHTMGTTAAAAAVVLGASLIEKHYTLDRSYGGLDAAFSMEPDELQRLCTEARNAWLSLGTAGYDIKPSEQANLKFRRSLYVVRDVAAGEQFTAENVRSIRPASGLPPKEIVAVLGRRASRSIKRGTPLDWSLVEV
jgi:N-acetylneuraminate synthase